MDTFTKLIKKKLVDRGKDAFVKELAELLGCSAATASRKLSGDIAFTSEETRTLVIELGISSSELYQTVVYDEVRSVES